MRNPSVYRSGLMPARSRVWRSPPGGTDAGDLDVLADMPARDGQRRHYEDLTANAQVVEAAGFSLRAAALSDIIASKEWADWPKDHKALPELRAILDAMNGP